MATRYIDKEFGADTSTAIANDTTGTRKVQNLPDAAGLVYDKVDNTFKFNQNGTISSLIDTGINPLTKFVTFTDAALAASSVVNQFKSLITLTPATTVTAVNGLNAIRGEVALTSGKTLGDGTASYVTGNYGRANIFGTVNIGSGALAALYGKMDLNGSTLTSGHIAPLQSNIVNPPADSSKVDLVYVESAGGNVINSHFKAFGKATYVFDIETNVHDPEAKATGTTTTQSGYLGVNINGSHRYLPLYTTIS